MLLGYVYPTLQGPTAYSQKLIQLQVLGTHLKQKLVELMLPLPCQFLDQSLYQTNIMVVVLCSYDESS